MKINKFKKFGSNKYKVYLDGSELILYEEVILKHELLYSKDIDLYKIDEIINDNKYYEAYHIALRYIEIKLRSQKELEEYLRKKEFEEGIINRVVKDIENLGLLNENIYIESFINDKVNLSNYGPYKIKNDLIKLDFTEEKINEYLSKIDDETWKNKIIKLINKKSSSSNKKSYYMFINKLKNDLLYLGYDREMIDNELSKIPYFTGDIESEIKKLKTKYKSDKYKIMSALSRKGYTYEEINKYF